MKKTIASALACAAILTACGGGNDSAPTSTAKVATLSYYGNPLQRASTAATVSKAAVAHADTVTAASDAAATVQTLTQALAAQGVTASITPQVMNGTTLHALIMGENNGLPPTNDQFKTDPNGWLVVNFQIDDMVTPRDDPAQVVALTQFQQDIYTFIQRAHVSGKLVFVILPIPTCDAPFGYSAADGVSAAIAYGAGQAGGFPVGGLPSNGVTDPDTHVITNTYTQGHLGADCRTPDAHLTDAWTQSIASAIAPALKQGL